MEGHESHGAEYNGAKVLKIKEDEDGDGDSLVKLLEGERGNE